MSEKIRARQHLREVIAGSAGSWKLTTSPVPGGARLKASFTLPLDKQAFGMLVGSEQSLQKLVFIMDIAGDTVYASAYADNMPVATCSVHLAKDVAYCGECNWAYIPEARLKQVVEMLVSTYMQDVTTVLAAVNDYANVMLNEAFNKEECT